jgi:MarR family transcriptional regulator, organic hydroperoxide resistance regulator
MTSSTQNILQHWREAVPNDRLAHLIRDTERAFRRALQLRLAAHDVPFGHWAFLRILWERDGLTQRELSEQAGVMEPTTFAAIKVMEERGYIERRQLPTNRKNVYVHLTRSGRALKKKLVPLAEDTNRISIKGLSSSDLLTARKVLLTLIENLAEDEIRPA